MTEVLPRIHILPDLNPSAPIHLACCSAVPRAGAAFRGVLYGSGSSGDQYVTFGPGDLVQFSALRLYLIGAGFLIIGRALRRV
jgi:hypothetical protein